MREPTELLPVADVEIVEPLPPELRRTTVYHAATTDGSVQRDDYRAFPAFMRSTADREVLSRTVLDPV